jgi:lipopolysaccharide O-acetyltransferase
MNNISIGNNVLMASKIYISDCLHGSYKGDEKDSSPFSNPINRAYSKSFVIIKNNVWIGESVSILPGVTIGEGSLIGANSVITSDIPDFCIAVGVPARIIKRFDFKTNSWVRVTN